MYLDNGFIKKHHAFVEDWDMPLTWWSRPYEYAWIMKRICKDDLVVDAGCGIEHPLKFRMAERCKKVLAVDSDVRILSMPDDLIKNIEYIHGDIQHISTVVKYDKVVCCSVLEHMTGKETINALKSFKECIKDDGKILLTCDYPTISPIWLLARASEIGLKFEEPFFKPTDNEMGELISGYNLNIFTLVLEKA